MYGLFTLFRPETLQSLFYGRFLIEYYTPQRAKNFTI